ncbi:hypothetical protein QYM36_009421 [Artemia franciscana]|uniref:Uncharacterized protein n=1 Tax=Artemia franciscana TaxID=6661 RepID=A0AA88HQW2_ARTSF|nr:hypothetical protein QYM36_009421 [Artemia franciscana]
MQRGQGLLPELTLRTRVTASLLLACLKHKQNMQRGQGLLPELTLRTRVTASLLLACLKHKQNMQRGQGLLPELTLRTRVTASLLLACLKHKQNMQRGQDLLPELTLRNVPLATNNCYLCLSELFRENHLLVISPGKHPGIKAKNPGGNEYHWINDS